MTVISTHEWSEHRLAADVHRGLDDSQRLLATADIV